jgi:hypothetical protein
MHAENGQQSEADAAETEVCDALVVRHLAEGATVELTPKKRERYSEIGE